MKHVEEAVAIRDRLLTAFDRASTLEPGPLRRRLLTVWSLEKRGAHVHLDTQLVSARHADLPIDACGLLVVRADLRVGTQSDPVPDAWATGGDPTEPPARSLVPTEHAPSA